MGPKRSAPQTPTSSKRAKTVAQTSIASFFTSPRKINERVKPSSSDVVEILDSDDEIEIKSPPRATKVSLSQEEEDAALARKLAAEWEEEDVPLDNSNGFPKLDKGKGREITPEVIEVGDTTPVRTPSPVKAIPVEVKSPPKPLPKSVHPMFAKPKAEPDLKRDATPADAGPSRSKGSTGITVTRAEAVEPIDFNHDSLLFRPERVDVSRCPGGRLPYSVLVGVYVQVAATRSRLLIVRVLTNFLHLLFHTSPDDLTPALYLLSNHLRPTYLPCELGIGHMVLSRAIKEVSGSQPRDLKRLWVKYGDPGDVAYEAKSNVRTLVTPAPLVAHDVYKRLLGLPNIRGPQSGKLKGDIVRRLMVQARGEEVRFLVRTLIGNLRIGAVRLTLLTALAKAALLNATPAEELKGVLPLPDKGKKPADPIRESMDARFATAIALVRRVYVRHPNYGDLIEGLKSGGLDGLEIRVPLSVGIPISPMLGSITRSIDEVYTRLGSLPFTAETKLDGQRLQMHLRVDGPQGEPDGGGRWVQADDGRRVWVRLVSRHLLDMTEKYPDICALALTMVTRALPAPHAPFPPASTQPAAELVQLLDASGITSLILDAEIVAVDKDTGEHRTFQELTNRAKKDVKISDIKVVVEVAAFDLMLLNDVPLLAAPFVFRRHLLRTLLQPVLDKTDPMLARFSHIQSIDSKDMTSPADLRTFFDSVVEQKAEGLMVKLLEGEAVPEEAEDVGAEAEVIDLAEEGEEELDEVDDDPEAEPTGRRRKKVMPATYEPDVRSQGWLKVKKDYLEGLGDSLDLVPVGAWWGNGRKAGWWSPILLAARNPESGALEAVCKCISGFSDAFYKALLVRYPPDGEPDVCSKSGPLGYIDTGGLVPDVWFNPSEVWEIRGADITLSPVYPAAATYIGGERGLSLRFPRFIRVRDDKGVDDATTAEEFADMYRRQMSRPAAKKEVVVAGRESDGEDAEEVVEEEQEVDEL